MLLFAGVGLSVLIRLLLLSKSFCCSLLSYLAKLYMTCFLFDVKFWQMDHIFAKFPSAIFCLICYYVCAEPATVVLLALILYKIKFSLSGFVSLAGFRAILATFSAPAQNRP